jgi:carotenoid 1,2-hydratase
MSDKDARPTGEMRANDKRDARPTEVDNTAGLQPIVPGDGGRAVRTGDARLGSGVQATGRADGDSGIISGRWGDSPRRGRTDGGLIGLAGSRQPFAGPRFDASVPPGGYHWWYIDALSEDRRYGLTIIAFIGSVFSSYYHWSGRDDPFNHVALNVALYGAGGHRWAMTERGRTSLQRDANTLTIGPSALRWSDEGLVIDIDEVTAPIRSRLRGRVVIKPSALFGEAYPLDPAGRHHWRPLAPRAAVEVTLEKPDMRWNGEAYVDSNYGVEPLEDGFTDWRWSRAHLKRDTAVLYEGKRRDGTSFAQALRFGADGSVAPVDLLSEVTLPKTGWRMPRLTRVDPGRKVIIRKTWEDTPFYARTALSTHMFGEAADAVHESLSLERLRSPIVRMMLPFRMPRIYW